tara:strand:+ start:2893 stop:3117 length:225 start_codon:yes stop_codon:yes gene_type:complete
MSENEKFKKLATARVNKAIKLLRLIGNLSNKSHYNYTTKDSKRIIDALQSEVSTIKAKFQSPAGGRSGKEFSLD